MKKIILYSCLFLFFIIIGMNYRSQVLALFAEKKITTPNILGNCSSVIGLENRRNCLKERNLSQRVVSDKDLSYKIVYSDNSEGDLISFDEKDLVKIKRPESLSFLSCISNTFFLDWDLDFIYLSLETVDGGIICEVPNGKKIMIVPKNISKERMLFLTKLRDSR